MGRWSTYRRRGGGTTEASTLISITSVFIDGSYTVFVVYTAAVTAGDFAITDFNTKPDLFMPDTVSQDGFNSLQLDFPDDITGQTKIEYTGAVSGILTPQIVDF